jgi:DNA-binding XRE family transcriptional regulator
MIKNDRQYAATQKQLTLLEQSLDQGTANSNMPEFLVLNTKNSIKSLINDLKKEILEYNLLKQKGIKAITVSDWYDFLLIPIKYRIANNLTIEQFAQKVKVHSRQIAGYEKEEYRNVTMSTFTKILEEININPTNFIKKAA